MVIRSQDKKCITTDLNLYIEPRERGVIGNVTCYIKNNTTGIIGNYSSWEKAIKVLDMIQSAYERYKTFSITYQDGLVTKMEERYGFEDTRKLISIVFNMPQDNEV